MNAPEPSLDSAGGTPGRAAAPRPGPPRGGVGGAAQPARLIEAALALFARQGFLDTSLAAIAREAGVTPAL
ncbi:helix-turn-helix domain-containing protein, partial [Paraburkholderia sp. BR14262]|uniref:helix-turn-helix domain-containing protein n=1 Tax=Paraburkholderia sp. BR14262 TaxID=3236999 RepID=UPI0034CD80AC